MFLDQHRHISQKCDSGWKYRASSLMMVSEVSAYAKYSA